MMPHRAKPINEALWRQNKIKLSENFIFPLGERARRQIMSNLDAMRKLPRDISETQAPAKFVHAHETGNRTGSREKRKFKRQRCGNGRPGNDSYSGHASEQVKKKQMGGRERET